MGGVGQLLRVVRRRRSPGLRPPSPTCRFQPLARAIERNAEAGQSSADSGLVEQRQHNVLSPNGIVPQAQRGFPRSVENPARAGGSRL
jgi:hypothetical protein